MNGDTKKLLKKGIIALNLGNAKKGKKYFEMVLKIEPNNIEALLRLGNIFGKFGKYNNAISCYDRILLIENNSLALINKGLALHYLQNFSKAIECYNSILKENPNSIITLYYKASSLIKLKQTDKSLEILQKVIKLDYAYKEKAAHDIDFQDIKNYEKFKAMISQ